MNKITRTVLRQTGSHLGWNLTVRRSLQFAGALLLCATSIQAADSPALPPLTTDSPGARLPGKMVWADLVTDDVPVARKFYSGLFGWTFREVGNYTIAANDERPLCGLFQRPRPAGNLEAHPRWFSYISVNSVAKAESVVKAARGRVVASPRKIPKRGEQAVFVDPEGAVFGVIKSSSGDPGDFLPETGDWIWAQLLSRDARKAAEFYQSVGGYEVVKNTAEHRPIDYVLASGGYARATVRTIPEENPGVQPNWLLFVRVADIGKAVAHARALGGRMLIEPGPELLQGKVAVVADPTGAAIGLLEWGGMTSEGNR